MSHDRQERERESTCSRASVPMIKNLLSRTKVAYKTGGQKLFIVYFDACSFLVFLHKISYYQQLILHPCSFGLEVNISTSKEINGDSKANPYNCDKTIGNVKS